MSGLTLLAVAVGGAVGATARFLITSWVGRSLGTGFPFGTLVVNLAGSFLIGVLIAVAARHLDLSGPARAFLVTGCLGALTTFSTFALDSVVLLERGQALAAFGYILVSVMGCIAAVFAGMMLVRLAAG